MHIQTEKTQLKLAELLHDHDGCDHLKEIGQGLANCWHQQRYMRRSGAMLVKLLPTLAGEMFPPVRADERAKMVLHLEEEGT